jgi:hypothetical protein
MRPQPVIHRSHAPEDPLPAIVVALFLVAHGLIHASFLSPAPPAKPGGPPWPFDLTHSRLLSPLGLGRGAARAVGTVLIAVTIVAYLVAALALIGIVPAAWFGLSVVIGSVASIVVLVVFFHPWLVLGLVIDAVLLWGVLFNGWTPAGAG